MSPCLDGDILAWQPWPRRGCGCDDASRVRRGGALSCLPTQFTPRVPQSWLLQPCLRARRWQCFRRGQVRAQDSVARWNGKVSAISRCRRGPRPGMVRCHDATRQGAGAQASIHTRCRRKGPTGHGTVPRRDVTRGERTHKALPPTGCGPMSQREVKGRVPSAHEGRQKGPGLDMVR